MTALSPKELKGIHPFERKHALIPEKIDIPQWESGFWAQHLEELRRRRSKVRTCGDIVRTSAKVETNRRREREREREMGERHLWSSASSCHGSLSRQTDRQTDRGKEP